MMFARVNGAVIHYRHREGAGLPIVFLNSLGTDFRIWERFVAHLPSDIPLLLLDKRGHGLSQIAEATMETYAEDAAALMKRRGLGPALVAGVSIGGAIAQCLALSRPDLVAGLLLSNTGAKIGDDETWNGRLDALETHGLTAMSDAVLERWFPPAFREARSVELEGWRTMLTRTPAEGYAIASRALRDTDLRGRAGAIEAPALCLAGSDDLATPPDLVRALADLVPGADYAEIEGAGHLPMIDHPEEVARHLMDLHGRAA